MSALFLVIIVAVAVYAAYRWYIRPFDSRGISRHLDYCPRCRGLRTFWSRRRGRSA